MSSTHRSKLVLVALALLVLTGCSAKQINPISLSQDAWSDSNQRVGVIMTKLPETDMVYPGAGCLLCLGVAAGMNSSLSAHSEGLSTQDLATMKEQIAEKLKAKGKQVEVLDFVLDEEELDSFSASETNTAEKDFTKVGKDKNLTHLIVVDFDYVGYERQYSSYVPTSEPYAKILGRVYMIDTASNVYKWYVPLDVRQHAEGVWDEPDMGFPGLTNAFYMAVERARAGMLNPLN